MSESLLLLAPLALCAGGVGLLLFRASPRLTFVTWTLVLFFVPIWIGATVGFFWAALTLITIAAIIANLADLRLTVVDGFVAVFTLLVLVLYALNLATLSASIIAILQWVLPYAWGRLVLTRVPARFVVQTIAAVAVAAALLALIEFATRTNLFVLVPGQGAYAQWSSLQPRAAFLRAEGAFGHSIALGASLAMSSAFVVAARWRTPVTLLALAALVGAVVVTFSRIGLITLGLTLALSVLLLPGIRRTVRWTIVAGGLAAGALIVSFIGSVFAEAGDEAGGSADYRGDLFTLLLEVRPLGTAGDWADRLVGGVYLGNFAQSVDNTLLLIALRFGWVPMLVVVLVLVATATGLLRGRANPASIAVTAQLPALLAVALITQFGMFLWFLAGLAIAWDARPRDELERRLTPRLSRLVPGRQPPGGGAAPSVARRP
ncbi:hypothetical protein [Agrococcus sp. ProA11]|uniref:hypothetical protein n=1 Tax=Agrococcus chionoecetis TaxID=3153752 RepID=UPI0032600D78